MWTRVPGVNGICRELQWFTDKGERLLAVAGLDLIDLDYVAILLERDDVGRFVATDVSASLTSLRAAAHQVGRMLRRRLRSEAPPRTALRQSAFHIVVPREKLSKSYAHILDHPGFSAARRMIDEIWQHHEDIDGNFLEQMQTSGFDARIWELYLFAALRESNAVVSRPKPAPDFHANWGNAEAFIEAVIVANSGAMAGTQEATLASSPTSPKDIHRLTKDYMPIRYGSPLFTKLQKRYWERPHVIGKPLVFAIADFHAKLSMTWSSTALLRYLYGVSHQFHYGENGKLVISPLRVETHEIGGKTVPSGFFFQENAEHVSAIVFSAVGTISKFNRMGCAAGFGTSNTYLLRYGTRHVHDENSALPAKFAYVVRNGDTSEDWRQGLSVFHNPRAINPLSPDAFPGCAHHWFREGGQIVSSLPSFHPYQSATINCQGERALRLAMRYIDEWLHQPFPSDAHDTEALTVSLPDSVDGSTEPR